MIFLSHNLRAGWRAWPTALCAVTFSLFVATALLYISERKEQALLSESVTTSGWVAYQAQLEYVKTDDALKRAALRPDAEALADVGLRLEILRSRLPLLYGSEDGRMLPEIDALTPVLQRFEIVLDGMIDAMPALESGSAPKEPILKAWSSALAPLGRELQSVLMASVAYNNNLFERERSLSEQPTLVPLALLFLSGSTLIILMLTRARRDREHLRAVEAARRAVTEMERNLRGVVQAAPSAMLVVDPAERAVRFINPAAAEMVHPSLDHPDWTRLIDTSLEEVQIGDDGGMILRIAFAKSGGDVVSLRGSLCPVMWEGRPQMLMVLIDNSRTRDADLQLIQAAKLATLGEMATAIAHELNQPLAVIRMAVANAHRHLDAADAREAVAAKLDRVTTQVNRAKRIIDQVRRYGRQPSGKAATFALRPTLELAAGFVAEQYRACGIRLALQLDVPADLAILGDRDLLEHVIVNLLINARDAFEQRAMARPRTVWLRARLHDQKVLVEVEDMAGGISEEVMAHLFEPFSTTKPAGAGAGLGLSLARSVVRDMNGHIVAENMRNGACITLLLPVARTPATREAA